MNDAVVRHAHGMEYYDRDSIDRYRRRASSQSIALSPSKQTLLRSCDHESISEYARVTLMRRKITNRLDETDGFGLCFGSCKQPQKSLAQLLSQSSSTYGLPSPRVLQIPTSLNPTNHRPCLRGRGCKAPARPAARPWADGLVLL